MAMRNLHNHLHMLALYAYSCPYYAVEFVATR